MASILKVEQASDVRSGSLGPDPVCAAIGGVTCQRPSIVLVHVQLDSMPDDGRLHYAAPAPVPRQASFSGSGLPFASPDQAFEVSPNTGVAKVGVDRRCVLRLRSPNAYYTGLGTVRSAPMLHIAYRSSGRTVTDLLSLGEDIAAPYRGLTYPTERTSAAFYDYEHPHVRSQEQILYASAYPSTNRKPSDFWGGRPPV